MRKFLIFFYFLYKMLGTEIEKQVKPHHYPVAIKVAIVIIVTMFFYTINISIKNFSASLSLSKWEEYLENKQYYQAIAKFQEVLKFNDSSKRAKISIAMAYFWNDFVWDDWKWLDYLEGIDIDEKDRELLEKVMPKEYSQNFNLIRQ